MKKLLIILLCLPLFYSCENNKGKNNSEKPKENTCNAKADYVMTDDEFMKAIQKDSKKYDGKIFELSVNYSNRCISIKNDNTGTMNFTIVKEKTKVSFNKNGGLNIESTHDHICGSHINFQYIFNNKLEEEYEDRLSDEKYGYDDNGSDENRKFDMDRIIKIKGKYFDEESDPHKYVLKEGCFIVQKFENYNN